MRILVTGAQGQLGRELQLLAGSGPDFMGPQAPTPPEGVEWLFCDVAPQPAYPDTGRLDITDRGAVRALFKRYGPHVVVNCAAYTDVDGAEMERQTAFRINAEGVRLLAEASLGTGAALVHISTDFVFDGRQHTPYTEQDTPAPLNVYGESKLAGERVLLETGCRGAIIRTSWLYSPWGRNFVKSILNAAAVRSEISVVSDQRGCPTAARELAGAIVRMIPRIAAESRQAGIYNYCDAGVVSRSDFAAGIIRQAGFDCRVVPVSSAEYMQSTSPLRPPCSALDTSKITRDYGIVPPRWQESLAVCLRQIKNGNGS